MSQRLMAVVFLCWPALGSAEPGQPGRAGEDDSTAPAAGVVGHAVRGDPTARYLLDVIARKGPGTPVDRGGAEEPRREESPQVTPAPGDGGESREFLRAYVGLNLAAALGRMLQGGR